MSSDLAPTTIDLSHVADPAAIDPLDFEQLLSSFKARFVAEWDIERARDPSLPAYDVQSLETDPAVIVGQSWSYLRLLDRQRVNDALKAVLAAFATGADLDHLVARNNVVRLAGENNERLLYRYLLSFDGRSAGSAARYIHEAMTAVPVIPIGGAAVIGRAIHGRRGETDIVVCGPAGRDLTDEEFAAVRSACLADHVVPEAMGAFVKRATRTVYDVVQTITVPQGASPAVIEAEAAARIRIETDRRTLIGAKVVRAFLAGAAAGQSVIDGALVTPIADIPADPYAVPVCETITVTAEVAS